MLLAEIVRVGEEGNSEFPGGVGVVGPGVGEDSVTLSDEGFRQKLAVVSKSDDGDFQACRRFLGVGLRLRF